MSFVRGVTDTRTPHTHRRCALQRGVATMRREAATKQIAESNSHYARVYTLAGASHAERSSHNAKRSGYCSLLSIALNRERSGYCSWQLCVVANREQRDWQLCVVANREQREVATKQKAESNREQREIATKQRAESSSHYARVYTPASQSSQCKAACLPKHLPYITTPQMQASGHRPQICSHESRRSKGGLQKTQIPRQMSLHPLAIARLGVSALYSSQYIYIYIYIYCNALSCHVQYLSPPDPTQIFMFPYW